MTFPLRDRIDGSLREAAGDEEAMADGVRAVYRGLEDAPHRVTDTRRRARRVQPGAVRRDPCEHALRWVVDNGGSPCPDAEDNSLAGLLVRRASPSRLATATRRLIRGAAASSWPSLSRVPRRCAPETTCPAVIDGRGRRERRPGRGRIILVVAAVGLFILVTSLRGIAGFYTDYLWFESRGPDRRLARVLGPSSASPSSSRAVLRLLCVNLVIADRLAPKFRPAGPEEELLERYHEIVGRRPGRCGSGCRRCSPSSPASACPAQWNSGSCSATTGPSASRTPVRHRHRLLRLPAAVPDFGSRWLFAALVIILSSRPWPTTSTAASACRRRASGSRRR